MPEFSNYALFTGSSGQLYRIDTVSGKTWLLYGSQWKEIKEEPRQ